MTWGQQRIANERLFKLGLRVLPHTARTYTPQRLHLGPGQCATSQRWRTFVRNHARALIIRGVAADLNRSLQVLAVRLMRFVQRWRGRSVARALQDLALHDAASGPGVWSPAIVDVISVDERGPPAMRPSHNHDPVTAARAA